jgi:hypothetical protein
MISKKMPIIRHIERTKPYRKTTAKEFLLVIKKCRLTVSLVDERIKHTQQVDDCRTKMVVFIQNQIIQLI